MKKLILKKNEEKRLNTGHLWIFSNEIQKIEGAPETGEIVELSDHSGNFAGRGFFNSKSLITFRLLTRERTVIDNEFWRQRIQKALAYRKSIYGEAESFRAVFGESDGLPGLIVDKYAGYLSVQFLSAGIEKNAGALVEIMREVFSPEGIIARNDSSLRTLEGLEEKTEVLFGKIPDSVEISENGVKFSVSLSAGQKTGFFFDQRENRQAFSAHCRNKSVLDCYCHTGGFGIYAAKAGASSVTLVDSSKPALEAASRNAALNGAAKTAVTVHEDVEKYLEELKREGKKFDIINLDPPALIKNKKSFFAGARLYEKLNATAMSLLSPGGILGTSSCSHHLGREDFVKMLRSAGGRAGKQFKVLELRSQAKDHPVLLSMPETEYLKFAIMRVI